MDVKNACNSVLNAIAGGRRADPVGPVPPGADRERRGAERRGALGAARPRPVHQLVPGLHDERRRARPSCSRRAPRRTPGILETRFLAVSRHWSIGTLPGGGTMRPHDLDAAYFDMDGRGLQRAFLELGPEPVLELLAARGLSWQDFTWWRSTRSRCPTCRRSSSGSGVPMDRTIVTVAEHGNLASATLPLQLSLARSSGMIAAGRARPADRARRRHQPRPGGGAAVTARWRSSRLGGVSRPPRRHRPVYNEAAGVTPTLEALAAQTDPDFDVVVRRQQLDGRLGRRHPVVCRRSAGSPAGASSTSPRRARAPPPTPGCARRSPPAPSCWPAPTPTACRAPTGPPRCAARSPRAPRAGSGCGWWAASWCRATTRAWAGRPASRCAPRCELAEAFGRVRSGNRDAAYLGPYMMAAGCNVGDHGRAVRRGRRLSAHPDRGSARGPRPGQRGPPADPRLRAPPGCRRAGLEPAGAGLGAQEHAALVQGPRVPARPRGHQVMSRSSSAKRVSRPLRAPAAGRSASCAPPTPSPTRRSARCPARCGACPASASW